MIFIVQQIAIYQPYWFVHRTQWLYDASDVIFPSVYMTEKIIPKNRPPMVRGRVKESMRLSGNTKRSAKPLVIVYHRYKFTDSLNYLSQVSLCGETTLFENLDTQIVLKFKIQKSFNVSLLIHRPIISEPLKPWKHLEQMVSFYGERGTI